MLVSLEVMAGMGERTGVVGGGDADAYGLAVVLSVDSVCC
jgi:hypothetical protein